MHLERDLASIKMWSSMKHSTQKKMIEVERLCACGYLGNMMNTHTAAGGQDNRLTTRQDLQEWGAPVRAMRPKGKSRGSQGFFELRRERLHAEGGVKMSRADRDCWQRRLADEWQAMSKNRQELYKARVARKQHDVDGPNAVPTYNASRLLGISNRRELLTTKNFEASIRKDMNLANKFRIGGHSEYAQTMRKKLVDCLFVADQGNLVS